MSRQDDFEIDTQIILDHLFWDVLNVCLLNVQRFLRNHLRQCITPPIQGLGMTSIKLGSCVNHLNLVPPLH